jgi:adhesin/invasin
MQQTSRLQRFLAATCVAAIAAFAIAAPASAGAGSGIAFIVPPDSAEAGALGTWTVTYVAEEDFATPTGGFIELVIPSGWTAPQIGDSTAAGYVAWTNPAKVDSVSVTGSTIRAYLGAASQFQNGDSVSVLYGAGGGSASARVQTPAPDTVVFLVRSDPQLSGSPMSIANSPWLSVVPGPVASVVLVDGSGAPVDTLSRTTDQDTTQLFLRGYDGFGNPSRLIRCDWTLTGAIGAPVPANGTGTALRLDAPGTGVAHADSAGVWADSTGLITVVHGAYAGLTMTAPGSGTAGAAFAVSARARDADGNTVTDGPGSAAALKFVAFADSVGPTPADPWLVSAGATLSGGTYAGTLTARRAGAFWFAAEDSAAGFVSERHRVDIAPGAPDRIALDPDTLQLTAGVADTVTVLVADAFGNRAPVTASETLTLWTDRSAGTFRNVAGTSTIFEVTVPAGADSARFTFTDTRTTVTEGRVRAIDANGTAPFLGTAGAPVFTGPNLPATITLTADPDTLAANGVDLVLVAGSASDAYGNTVAQGERFTLSGSLVTPATDQDSVAAGAQLLADSTGAVGGYVRVGTTAGAGSATATAERGGANRTVAIRLLAGVPSGAIALSAPADSVAADSIATLSIGAAGLTDANGNQVENGEKYTVATTLGAIQTTDADPSTPGVQVSAGGGAVSFTLFGGDAPGTAVVTAKSVRDTTSSGILNVRLVPGGISASRSTVTADSPVPVGATGSIVAITLRDSQDHPLAGVPDASVAVTVTGVSATVTALGSATDAGGRIDFRATATVADTGLVQVTARGVPLADEPGILFQPGPLDHYTIAGPAGPLTAGTGVTLAVSAFDSFANPLPGQSGDVLRPTVTSGGAVVPDSVVLAGGAASIPVAPTVASPLTILVSDGPRSVTYGPVPVNPSGAATLTLAPDSLSLTPTQTGTVTLTVRDPQGNPIPGYSLTFYLGGPSASGTLESVGETSGGPGSQSGVTNSSGMLTARYRAPSAAPVSDSIFASGGSLGPVGIRAATAPGPTAALSLAANSLSWTAGVPESVIVRAIDAFGNFVTTDVATVTMRPSGSVTWSPASGPLAAGRFVTLGRDTVAEPVAIGADRAGGGSGTGGNATVAPAAPGGAIAIAATRDSLTADGRSASSITLGPVRDAFGNLVSAGTLIGVSAQAGTLLASDASALYPGLDLATGADGRASVVLIAASAAGPDTLSAATRTGSAAGTRAFTYVPPPSLAYVAGSLTPGATTPGSGVTFSLQIRNTGSGSIQIDTGSTFSFGSGVQTFAATVASAASVGPGVTATLAFSAATVPAALPPGTYAPSFRAVGTDGTGAVFDFYLSLAGAQVSVLGITVAAVGASPDPAPLGYQNLSLVFDVSNLSGTPGDLSGASMSYSTGTFITGAPTPPLGTTIPAGTTTRFTFPAQVPSGGIPSGTTVNATLQATVSFGGNPVVASSPAPLAFRVVSAAQISAIAGSSTPQRLLRGRASAPSVRVANAGAAAVTLNRGTTRLSIDLGGSTLTVGLSANTAVAASDQATLAFDSLAVPANALKGLHPASLFLDGVESGQAFTDTIPFAPDSVTIVDPALLSVVAGSLDPDTVSAGQARPVSLTLQNDGDVPLSVDPSTALRFGPPVAVRRTLGISPTLNAGQSLVLTFAGGPLGSPASPGGAASTLEVFGLEEGVARAQSLSAETLHARPPAALQFVARTTRPDQTRPGQTIDVTLDVSNAGGSPFVVDPAASRFTVTDGQDVMTGLGSGSPFPLAPGATAALTFPGVSIPASMASQPYRVDLFLQGMEWGLAGSFSVSSPDSEIVVLQPLAAVQVRGIDTAPPVQVAPGGTPVRVWGVELTPLIVMGSSTVDSLRSVAITVLSDGSTGTAPAGSIASIALRDRAGALLVQSVPAPGAPNPINLVIVPPLAMGSAPESLFVEVAFRPGTSARRVAFQLTQATDVVAVDVVTGTSVPIVGGGGLSFMTLRSGDITFFDRPHGYPNPFHAGSEAILLSYVLGQDAAVKVSIYTLLGDLVREISLGAGSTGGSGGLNEVPWDGRNGKGELVRPGVYVAKIDGPGVSEQIKVGVLR